ncbi:hypothetical protein V1512DRAFT_34139 [Lipomyces arxii]|uniref:uncharacterized protein n=1 Tax=Lipomyces arxii TaxID=56418 RepID=UPI0034CEFFC9
MSGFFTQSFPPEPKFTEDSICNSLAGKVFLVTGGYSGVGFALSKILWAKGGRVIIVGRDEAAYEAAKTLIEAAPTSFYSTQNPRAGSLEFCKVDLADLTTIKPAIETLLTTLDRLDVAWYNAGVMHSPAGSTTKQNLELQWGINVVAHFALHKMLIPILNKTAASEKSGTVRTVWVSSLMSFRSPKPYGINFEDVNYRSTKGASSLKYGQSKAAAVILAHEYAKRAKEEALIGEDGAKKPAVVSVSANPGNLKTNLQRHQNVVLRTLSNAILLYPQRLGGYTELFAGLSPQIGEEDFNGQFVIPFGRKGKMCRSIETGLKEADTGKKLWDMLEEEVKPYI